MRNFLLLQQDQLLSKAFLLNPLILNEILKILLIFHLRYLMGVAVKIRDIPFVSILY